MTSDNTNADPSMRAGRLLAALGRELRQPFSALVTEIHRLDEQHDGDDSVAELVELVYKANDVVEPLTALAAFEMSTETGRPCDVDVTSVVRRVGAAHRIRLAVRGELGTSFEDARRLEEGLSLFSRIVYGASKVPTDVQAVREVHAASDRIVLSSRCPRHDDALGDVRLELGRRVASALGGTLETGGETLRLELPVRVAEAVGLAGRPLVLAFRREAHDEALAVDASEAAPIVLVVDEEPAARDYVTRVLELEGYQVTAVADLGAARKAAEACRPDVILVDPLELGRQNGDDLGGIKDAAGLRPIPFVFVGNPDARQALGPVDASDVVSKPIDPAELLRAVRRQTGGRSSPLLLIRPGEDAARWERYLEQEVLRVVTANDAAEARRLIDTMTPSAVVLDVEGVPGSVSLLKQIREEPRTRDVPVLAVSGRMSKKDRLHLESLVNARMRRSALGRTALRSALRDLLGGARLEGTTDGRGDR